VCRGGGQAVVVRCLDVWKAPEVEKGVRFFLSGKGGRELRVCEFSGESMLPLCDGKKRLNGPERGGGLQDCVTFRYGGGETIFLLKREGAVLLV